MKRVSFIFLFLTTIITANLQIHAEVRFVSIIGSSTQPYTSWATAADSIQKCINISRFGDTIYVANGTYYEQVVMIPGLTLIGSGMDSCIIDTKELAVPSGFYAVRAFDSCTVKGFRVVVSNLQQHGDPYMGFGIYANTLASAEGLNLIIENNKVNNAFIGISAQGFDAQIKKNIVSDVERGIYISQYYANKGVEIENNTIYLNHKNAWHGITFAFGVPLSRIVNNVIIFQKSESADGIFTIANDSCFIANNAILYLSTPRLSSYGYAIYNGGTKFFNNLIYGDFRTMSLRVENDHVVMNNVIVNSSTGVVAESPVPSLNFKYNNVWNCDVPYSGFTPDSTNISVDPMFVDEDSLDFHLQMFSPLIDAGDPNILDKDGSRSDIGLYGGPYGESYTYQDFAPKPPKNLTATLEGEVVTLSWLPNTEADFYQYRVYRDSIPDFIYDTTKIFGTNADTTFNVLLLPGNSTYFKITAIDDQNNQSPASEEVGIIFTAAEEPKLIANDYQFYPNYPNPFNPSTTLSYRLKDKGTVRLVIYDIKGEKITELVNEYQQAGYYKVNWDAKAFGLSSGIYLFRIEVKNENNIPVFSDVRKSILLK